MAPRRRSSDQGLQASAMSVHIGLNSVDPKHYVGWSGELNACENDARDMAAIAATRGMATRVLLTPQGTRMRLLAELRKAATKLAAGDFFFLTYSGHGGQVPDVTGEEGDKQDETWCLYDGQLIDDELYFELGRFKRGVRILVLSDSCHSGTVVRMAPPVLGETDGRSKLMPQQVGVRTYRTHQKFYDQLQRTIERASAKTKQVVPDGPGRAEASPRVEKLAAGFAPALILISGCQDNQTSLDGNRNGAFTGALLSVWNHGTFTGSYRRFHQEIVNRLPATQTPNLFTFGAASRFLAEQPFSVRARTGTRVTVESATRYLARLTFPRMRPRGATVAETLPAATAAAFDGAKNQAAVVGGSVISFVSGVTPERRDAIVNSSLLAQLVATKVVPDLTRIYDWYDHYFNALANIGWVVQDRGFSEYSEASKNFATHKAILNVATALLGPTTTALAIVKTTLEALQSMNESSPWLTIFNKETQHAKTARFQVGLAEQDSGGQFFVNLMAFGLEAKASITQVLFFKSKKSQATLRYYSGRVTINTAVLDGIREAIVKKLASQAADYVATLPDL